MPVKIDFSFAKVVLARCEDLSKREILVGIPRDENERTDPTTGLDEEVGNALLGYIHEFGAPAARIPARPFLIPGVQNALPECIKRLFAATTEALYGRDPIPQLTAAGFVASESAKQVIEDVIPVPLAPITIRNRRRRGFMGTTPLLETGQLRNAITFVLAKKGDLV